MFRADKCILLLVLYINVKGCSLFDLGLSPIPSVHSSLCPHTGSTLPFNPDVFHLTEAPSTFPNQIADYAHSRYL